MELEELVPDIKLCELIPEGEFEDAALWHLEIITVTGTISKREIIRSEDKYLFENDPNIKLYPAPTFVEIIDDLPVWETPEELLYAFDSTERALKLWLKWKGIENDTSC